MPDSPSLAGPLARLDRADALVQELTTATKAFAATKPYRATQIDDPNPVNRRFILDAVDDVPLPIRVRAGEIVHHTRAALDLLVYQLLLRGGEKDDRGLRKFVRSFVHGRCSSGGARSPITDWDSPAGQSTTDIAYAAHCQYVVCCFAPNNGRRHVSGPDFPTLLSFTPPAIRPR